MGAGESAPRDPTPFLSDSLPPHSLLPSSPRTTWTNSRPSSTRPPSASRASDSVSTTATRWASSATRFTAATASARASPTGPTTRPKSRSSPTVGEGWRGWGGGGACAERADARPPSLSRRLAHPRPRRPGRRRHGHLHRQGAAVLCRGFLSRGRRGTETGAPRARRPRTPPKPSPDHPSTRSPSCSTPAPTTRPPWRILIIWACGSGACRTRRWSMLLPTSPLPSTRNTPGVLLQFEDFASEKAFAILERLRDKW